MRIMFIEILCMWKLEFPSTIFPIIPDVLRAWGGVVVKVMRYYSDNPGIDSRWCHWIFQWHIPSDRTMTLMSTQPLVKMSTRNISWG